MSKPEASSKSTPSRLNAFGQPLRPPSPADKRRASAWAPFLSALVTQPGEGVRK